MHILLLGTVTLCFCLFSSSHPLGFLSVSNDLSESFYDSSSTNPLKITPPLLNFDNSVVPVVNVDTCLAGIQWDPFNVQSCAYLHMTTHNCTMRNKLKADKVAFWNVLLPTLRGTSISNLQDNIGITNQAYAAEIRIWALIGVVGILLILIMCLVCIFLKSKLTESSVMCKVWHTNARSTAV